MKNHVVNVVHMLSHDVLYKACKGIFLCILKEKVDTALYRGLSDPINTVN